MSPLEIKVPPPAKPPFLWGIMRWFLFTFVPPEWAHKLSILYLQFHLHTVFVFFVKILQILVALFLVPLLFVWYKVIGGKKTFRETLEESKK